MLQPKDYVGLKLTGETCIDSSAASCMRWHSDDTGDITSSAPRSQAVSEGGGSVGGHWEVTREAADETGGFPQEYRLLREASTRSSRLWAQGG